ncbi:MAG: hypothetical protein ACR2OE_09280 [Thermomicrobiales bacterium]
MVVWSPRARGRQTAVGEGCRDSSTTASTYPHTAVIGSGTGRFRRGFRQDQECASRPGQTCPPARRADHGPTLLRLINPEVTSDTKIAALDMVLAFPIAPAGYHADMLLCLGFSDQASSSDQVFAAAKRLAIGTVELLQSAATASDHDQWFAGAFEDGLDVALADGTLLAYLNQD